MPGVFGSVLPSRSCEQLNRPFPCGGALCAECCPSGPRVRPYLSARGADEDRTLRLHCWNVGLCQALAADISHFEAALSNVYDCVMRERDF